MISDETRKSEEISPRAPGPTSRSCTDADLARYAAAIAASHDPEQTMKAGEHAFRDMTLLTIQNGDQVAAAGASIAVQNACLQLCVSPAMSEKAADDRCRFLCIVLDWAWPRVPAVAAVLEASLRADRLTWGDDVGKDD